MARSLLPLAALLAVLLLVPAPLNAQVPPDAAWRTLDTPHFRVTFTPELESVARRAADRAERAYGVLSTELVAPPRGKIDLVVTDHVDLSNGSATPFPSNRVVLYAAPPVSVPELAFYDDWLDLLIIHELVHVFQLDHAGAPWMALRRVLGRNPLLFPQIWTPGWVLEGLAVYFESRLTGAGRVRGTEFEMALRTAILEDAFFSIDRASGDPIRWPAGSTRYIYGGLFMEHLAQTYGPASVRAFVREAGSLLVPYRIDAPARRAFGVSFRDAWRAWEDSLRTRYAALADSLAREGITEPELLTRDGRSTFFPRYAPDGALAFVSATGADEPSVRLLEPNGGTRVVAPLSTLAPVAWLPDGSGFLHAQLEYADRDRIHSDLFQVGRDGARRRLTRSARIWEPDLHPDGRTVVAVANVPGTNALVAHDLATGERRTLVEPSLDVAWAAPRWSPDGTRIAVSRWRTGGYYDVLILDASGSTVAEVTADRAVNATPAWSPDGRFVLFSSDRTGIPNLLAYEVESGRLLQVTRVLTGASQPEVSPDSRWIAFAYYRAHGYEIARLPYDPAAWREAPPVRAPVAEAGEDGKEPRGSVPLAEAPARRYSPWPTVRPTTWLPLVQGDGDLGTAVGAWALGLDLVGRHEWSAEALVHTGSGRLEGLLDYRYRGLGNPELTLRLEQDWRVQWGAGTPVGGTDQELPTALLRRDRTVGAGARWLRPRWRASTWAGLTGELVSRQRVWADPAVAPENLQILQLPDDLGGALDFGLSSARGFAFSPGPQQGVTLAATLSGHRFLSALPGEDGKRGYQRAVGRSRGFQALGRRRFARDVLAARLDAGIETGSLSPGFEVGGTGGGTLPIPFQTEGLGRGAFPLRGYSAAAQVGDRAVIGSLEYRFPLALVERGLGTLPAYLGRLSGDVFVDAGTAWCASDCERRFPAGTPTAPHVLTSLGAELLAEFKIGFFAPVPLRVGFALPLRDGEGGEAYLRVGRAF